MHGFLNNLKILGQGIQTISLTTGANSFAHAINIDDPVQCLIFIKFPDGKVTLTSYTAVYSYDGTKFVSTAADKTNIYIQSSGNFSVTVSFFFLGKGKAGTVDHTKPFLGIAAPGFDDKTETNPDNYYFLNKFATLKYYYESFITMGNVNTTTIATINHNLGYIPFFAAYVSDLQQFPNYNNNNEPVYALTPYYLARSSIGSPTQDVGAFVYADATNIYLKAYFQANAIGTTFPFNKFLFKIFKNNLNI